MRVEPLERVFAAASAAYLGEEEPGDNTERLAAERDEERLVDEGGHPVPGAVERVRDGRAQHTVEVHQERLRAQTVYTSHWPATLRRQCADTHAALNIHHRSGLQLRAQAGAASNTAQTARR